MSLLFQFWSTNPVGNYMFKVNKKNTLEQAEKYILTYLSLSMINTLLCLYC